MNRKKGRSAALVCCLSCGYGSRLLFYGRWADGKRWWGVPKCLRWGHAEAFSESWVAFCAAGLEPSLQRLWRSVMGLLASYRAGHALHQLHPPLGSEGGAFGDLSDAAFAR